MRFAHPFFFLLFLYLPLLALRFFHPRFRVQIPTLQFPVLQRSRRALQRAGRPRTWLPPVLRLLALALFIMAAARPQLVNTEQRLTGEGIDILLALDISGSMEAADFRPRNRLHVAKDVLADFIQGRVGDRIGLVVFASNSFTQCPLTLDYSVLQELLEQVDPAMGAQQGTAIGMGLASALNRLRKSDASSRIVVLLTDGRNNAGKIDPSTAATMASSLGIRVYTIGVGRDRFPPILVKNWLGEPRYERSPVPMDPDEDLLKKVAEQTGGRYYRATDAETLSAVFSEIDQLEKSEFELLTYSRFDELMHWPLLLGMALLLLELVLIHGRYRPIP